MTAITTAELAIYTVLILPVLYLIYAHGKHGVVGWLYLAAFCSLRIIGGGLAISGSKSATIISSVGLSPLLLSSCGILQEARQYLFSDLNTNVELSLVLLYHLMVSGGIAILATGASGLQSKDPKPNDASLIKVGIAVIAMDWVFITAWTVWTYPRSLRLTATAVRSNGRKLVYALLFASIFIGIRVIYALVGFVTNISPSTTVQVVLGLLPELIVTLAYIAVGLATRHAKHDFADEFLPKPRRRYEPSWTE